MRLSVRTIVVIVIFCALLSIIAVASLLYSSRERLKDMRLEGVLILERKGEVVGNLIAASLYGSGVEFFSFGEFFEAQPLIRIEEPTVSIRWQIWVDGVSYRRILAGSVELEDMLAAYDDTLVYVLSNPSGFEANLRLDGILQVFSWFNPDYRRIISERASVRFEISNGYLKGSYKDLCYVYLTSNRGLTVEIEPEQASYSADVKLSSGEDFIFVLAGASSEEEAKRRVDDALVNYSRIEESRRKQVNFMLAKTPKLTLGRSEYEQLWRYLWYVILSNRVTLQRHPVLNNPFNMPSKFVFRHQWLWDSAFHAIILAEYNVSMAEEELMNLFVAQKPDGRIPHEVFISKEFCGLFWEVDDYAPWTTQPPVLAIAVERVMEKGGSENFLRRAFDALDRYDNWFRNHRDADGDQLMSYVDYLESGWDNAVRWDRARALFQSSPERYQKLYSQIRMAPVEAVDLNSFIYTQRSVLARLAERLGLHEKAEEYLKLAEQTAEGVRKNMWDAETQFYYDMLEENNEILKVKSPAAFATMFAGIATREQAESLLEHLLNSSEFWTRFPLPTVSADHPDYDPEGYWRGRSWINQVWLTYQGLKRYGFQEEAKLLAEKVLNAMASGPTCNENYNSLTGTPLGAPDFGWSTLALEFLMDLR
jgi:glycogen debranching enzyme